MKKRRNLNKYKIFQKKNVSNSTKQKNKWQINSNFFPNSLKNKNGN